MATPTKAQLRVLAKVRCAECFRGGHKISDSLAAAAYGECPRAVFDSCKRAGWVIWTDGGSVLTASGSALLSELLMEPRGARRGA